MLVCAPVKCFLKNFNVFFFSRSLKAIKRQWTGFRQLFAVVNMIKMIFLIKLRFHKGRCLPVIIWLCPWFSSIYFIEISQDFHNLLNLSCWSFKSQKNRSYKGSFLAIWNFVFSPQVWSSELLQMDTRKGTNLKKFHRRKAINFAQKIPIFLLHNISLWNRTLPRSVSEYA